MIYIDMFFQYNYIISYVIYEFVFKLEYFRFNFKTG
jgi:hypothetical protein